MATLQASRSAAPWTVRYALDGEIDMSNGDEIRAAATAAVEAERTTMVLDLARVSFMDWQGLKAVLDARQLLRESGGTLVLERPGAEVRRLLAMTSLDGLLGLQ